MDKVKMNRFLLFSCVVSVYIFLAFTPAQAKDSAVCISCHENASPGLVGQWRGSKHGENEVGCLDCHGTAGSEPDTFEHWGQAIAIIVSPLDCARCHYDEYTQQKGSHHAKAGQILGSLDNLLGEVVGGMPAVDAGCRQCHGSIVKVDSTGHPTPDSWPNTGMGRINPDGSWGSCSACHTRHQFSVRQARQPEACGKCHLGPDHPQIEVWNESKHGVMYHASREDLNLEAENWRAGKEYFVGPTCASCHMSAAAEQEVTHDVGERIAWTLRPPISKKLNMVVYEDNTKEDILGDNPVIPKAGKIHTTKSGQAKKVKATLTWQERRARMQNICQQCHNISFVRSAYKQFDKVVLLYNEKFAQPTSEIMAELRKTGKITSEDFDDPIEWTWWELWHHEGRRARHGASMQGPDYTWWHGMYEVAKHFYNKFIPEMEEVAGKTLTRELLNKYVYTHPGHQWHRDGMGKDALEKMQEFYKKRYDQ